MKKVTKILLGIILLPIIVYIFIWKTKKINTVVKILLTILWTPLATLIVCIDIALPLVIRDASQENTTFPDRSIPVEEIVTTKSSTEPENILTDTLSETEILITGTATNMITTIQTSCLTTSQSTTTYITTTTPVVTTTENITETTIDALIVTEITETIKTQEVSTTLATEPETEIYIEPETEKKSDLVWVPTNGGKKYHKKSSCSNMDNPVQMEKEEAIANGFDACKRCY